MQPGGATKALRMLMLAASGVALTCNQPVIQAIKFGIQT